MMGENAIQQLDLKYHTHDGHDSPKIKLDDIMGNDQFYTVEASEILQAELDNQVSDASDPATYNKKKEALIRYAGTVKIRFDFARSPNDTSSWAVYARIYVNGSAVGTERVITSQQSPELTTYTENISVAENDLVQLYLKGYGYRSYSAVAKNFRVYYTKQKDDEVKINMN